MERSWCTRGPDLIYSFQPTAVPRPLLKNERVAVFAVFFFFFNKARLLSRAAFVHLEPNTN